MVLNGARRLRPQAGLEEEGEIGGQVWRKWHEKRSKGYASI